jgi:membrane-bound ClpP family serine protease
LEDLARFFTSWFANLNLSLESLQVNWWVIALIGIAAVAFIVITIVWGIRAHRRKVSAGREEMIGKTAEVKTFMPCSGRALECDARGGSSGTRD